MKGRFRGRIRVAAVAAAMLSGLAMGEGTPTNVLLFTIDSCRADRFGVYGNPQSPTPRIDAWSRSGTVFSRAYSTSAWTAPGLVSALSGLHPPTHGINNRDRMGSPELLTLAKIFRQRGYLTPNLNFFSFAPYYTNLGLGDIDRRYFGKRDGDELLNWLKEHSADEPFFLWYHTTIVHQPYDPGEANLPRPAQELAQRPAIQAVMKGAIVPVGSTQFQEGDGPILKALYDAEMSRMDRLFGKALDLLQEKGLLGDTLIVLTADHGEELLDHGFVGHASTSLQAKLYEEFLHIPLLFSWPGKVPEGKTDDRLASQIDILPTILGLMGIEVPDFVQGSDLLKVPRQRSLYFESVIAGNQTTKEREHLWLRAVRQGDWKYISSGELYRLDQDPQERNDLAAKFPQKARRLEADLERWLRESAQAAKRLFPADSQVHTSMRPGACPVIHTPGNQQTLGYDVHTGSLLFDWSGDLSTDYRVEYDIGKGDHHVAGVYEVQGNHQLMGPLPRELWTSLKAWNPFRIRVSPKTDPPCWSEWVTFRF